jgi:two-component system, chemotaxis family, protein-glutamate methylesterase/glutaminase
VNAQHRPTIRVVVAETATDVRAQIVRMLEADGDIAVIAQAGTTAEAIDSIVSLRPDMASVDLHLPGGGVTVIQEVMARAPTPILVLSQTVDDTQTQLVVEALSAGALDALPKPVEWTKDLGAQLRRTVRLLTKVHVVRHRRSTEPRGPTPASSDRSAVPHVVAIAASTGGPSALAIVLAGLGGLAAPVLVVQHLHEDFTAGLVEWMSRESALPVQLAEDGDTARAGRVYVAPGGVHLRLGPALRLELDAAPVAIHRPSADQLFFSLAEQVGAAAVGVLLTGMGDDGARGLLAIQRAGGRTLAQDEASSAVFGMPAAAQRLGAVTELLAPEALGRAITRATKDRHR